MTQVFTLNKDWCRSSVLVLAAIVYTREPNLCAALRFIAELFFIKGWLL